MFKLIKILNSGANVPEPIKAEKIEIEEYGVGTPVVIEGGKIAPAGTTTPPTHITLAKAKEGSTAAIIAEITSDMIFETYINADPASVKAGSKLTLGLNSSSHPVCVTATTQSGVATVVSTLGAKRSGDKITVKF
jgi:hypothetical protein